MIQPIYERMGYLQRKERNKILDFLSEVDITGETRRLEDLLQQPTSIQMYISVCDRYRIDEMIKANSSTARISLEDDQIVIASVRKLDEQLDLTNRDQLCYLADSLLQIVMSRSNYDGVVVGTQLKPVFSKMSYITLKNRKKIQSFLNGLNESTETRVLGELLSSEDYIGHWYKELIDKMIREDPPTDRLTTDQKNTINQLIADLDLSSDDVLGTLATLFLSMSEDMD